MSRQLFQPATKQQARARIGLSGPSGSGKTMWALQWASVLAEGGKVAFLDTERGSASLYADQFAFDVLEMTQPFHPDRLVEALASAREAGYQVVIVDSLTHFWSGKGGVLEIVDDASNRFKGNSHAAWQVGTPIQQRMVDAILGYEGHVIATMRSKTEWVMEQGSNGKTTPRKIGLAPQQRSDIEFEFTLFMELDHMHRASVTKTRFGGFADKVFNPEESERSAQLFAEWLRQGKASVGASQRDVLRQRVARLTPEEQTMLKTTWKFHAWPRLDVLNDEQIDAVFSAIETMHQPLTVVVDGNAWDTVEDVTEGLGAVTQETVDEIAEFAKPVARRTVRPPAKPAAKKVDLLSAEAFAEFEPQD